MIKFIVHQVKMTGKMADQINANGREWALKNIPAYRTYMDTMSFGGKRFEPAQFEHYSQQVGVQATDLDEVFEITNLWNRPEQILFKNQPRSVSVGDIIENTETGEFFMVDMFGFTQVTPA